MDDSENRAATGGMVRSSAGKFLPGNHSGGRRALPPEVVEMYRGACPKAAQRLIEGLDAVNKDGDADHAMRTLCGERILDRYAGKPAQAVTNGDGTNLFGSVAGDLLEAMGRIVKDDEEVK
jgi:hypothetical protein